MQPHSCSRDEDYDDEPTNDDLDEMATWLKQAQQADLEEQMQELNEEVTDDRSVLERFLDEDCDFGDNAYDGRRFEY